MPSDTFKYVQAGQAASPGTCAICGFDRRDFIDFGITAEYYGAILVCVECIGELSNVEQLDFVRRSDYDAVTALNNSLTGTIREYEGLRQGLEDGLVRVSRDFTLAFDNVGVHSVAPVSGEKATPRNDSQAPGEDGPDDEAFF